jgi:hypothetical protein
MMVPQGHISWLQDHTATVWCRFEPRNKRGLQELLCKRSHYGEIHAANQFRVFSSQRIKGAVAQHDGAVGALRFVPISGQSLAGAGEQSLAARPKASG